MVKSERHTAGKVRGRLGEALTVLAGLVLILMVLAGPAAAAPDVYAAVCPQAPPGTQDFADQVVGWVKWGVIIIIGLGGLVSVGALAGGRIFNNPHASSKGAVGLTWAVAAAIAYGVFYLIINEIIGSGCT